MLTIVKEPVLVSITTSPSATNASSTLLPTHTVPITQSTEFFGIEVERVNIPQTTTDGSETTVQEITMLDIKPGGVMIIHNNDKKTKDFFACVFAHRILAKLA